MREHRSLGPSRGARGVEEPRERITVDGHDGARVVRRGDERVVIDGSLGNVVGTRDHDRDVGAEAGREHDRRPVGISEHRGSPRVVDVVGDVVGGEPAVEWHEAVAGLEAGVHGLEQFGAVSHQHTDTVAALHTERREAVSERVRAPVERRVRERPVAVRHGRVLRESPRRCLQHATDVHRRPSNHVRRRRVRAAVALTLT